MNEMTAKEFARITKWVASLEEIAAETGLDPEEARRQVEHAVELGELASIQIGEVLFVGAPVEPPVECTLETRTGPELHERVLKRVVEKLASKPQATLACRNCGEQFVTNHGWRYCGPRCRAEFRRRAALERYHRRRLLERP